MDKKQGSIRNAAVIAALVVAAILIVGTILTGQSARRANEEAVRSVSLFYLDELAGRREQVVANALEDNITKIQTAINLMTEEDLSDGVHRQAYQTRMKRLFNLEKFAFVDEEGFIYTSTGLPTDIRDYSFDYLTLSGPEISVRNLQGEDKKVVIAVPAGDLPHRDHILKVCFMEIDMDVMLQDLSMQTENNEVTFSNIYTSGGVALTNAVLGGLAAEDNLLDAMAHADFEEGYSLEKMTGDFAAGTRGVVSFTYDGIQETLSYVPVEGTDWMLTYLIRESLISEQISGISAGIVRRSLIQSLLTALALFAMFGIIIRQTRRSAQLELEKETQEAANRAKQEELEQRLSLQEQLVDTNKMLADALQTAEDASKAKTVFLSNMSHEIRTPMNAIIGLDSIALNDETLTPETRGHLEKINSSAQHLLNLINDILDMSRIESGRLVLKNEEFSFPHLLEQINTMISGQCSEKGLQYHCRVGGQLADYYIGDDMKLRQVLLNILGNAVKFTPEGGSVEFSVEPVANFEGKTTLRMVMKDTGIGMDAEYLPRLFDAFSQEDSSNTSKYGSTGLGMAITKSIVEMMNGDIEVESEKGTGTTFTVTVTLQDSDRRDSGEEEASLDPQSLSVLIVDDDPIACEHAHLVLEKVGISSETAPSGEEAVEMVRLRHARRAPYNLILVDWKMPGMDGVETTRQIRSIVGRESAIIFLTAYKWDEVLEEAVEAGVDSFLAKPLFASNVLDEFVQAMKKRGMSDAPPAEKADLRGRRVLMAEDVEINAEIMIMLLSMKEMEVEHAENGRIAVDMFAASEEGYYDAA